MIYQAFFSFFGNSDFSILFIFFFFGGGGLKRQKMTQNYQFQSFMLNISGTVDQIIKIFGTLL